jgi:FkbH-like protein
MGRLFPRFSLTNPEYFVSRLNEYLEKLVRRNSNAYVLDLDRLAASVGRRYAQDDAVAIISHNGILGGGAPGTSRIEPIAPFAEHYEQLWHNALPDLVRAELLAMYRTLRQIDPVKVVVVDLDDTLWHGVSGDMTEIDGGMLEGWPIGLAEALMYLKKRGILLAIASKNEASRIREIWPRIFGNGLRLEDFAAVRINWQPKTENMKDILEGMNLLPRNAVFIDDNPAEREAMRREFPDLRILGRHPYYLKRILLWSPETQVAVITAESGRRTEMIQAQFARETQRKTVSREQFLRDAELRIATLPIDGAAHERFARVFELINKTNQFNTTGRRWKLEECEEFFRCGGRMLAFEVTDRFTFYGLVGVVLFRSRHIEQWVMSCRVLGYQVENAVMARVVAAMRAGEPGAATARLVLTDVNFPCRGLFRACGFTESGTQGDWMLPASATIDIPEHITMDRAG